MRLTKEHAEITQTHTRPENRHTDKCEDTHTMRDGSKLIVVMRRMQGHEEIIQTYTSLENRQM